jgi:hypothetical protein
MIMGVKRMNLSPVMILIFALAFLVPYFGMPATAIGNGVQVPEVVTYHARDVYEDSAKLRGIITVAGDIIEVGFYYDDNREVDESDTILPVKNSLLEEGSTFYEILDGLEEGQTYYFRAYAKFNYGTENKTVLADNIKSFTTGPWNPSDGDLEIITDNVKVTGEDEATLYAHVDIDENDWDERKYEIPGCYFFYSTIEDDVDDPSNIKNVEEEIVYSGEYDYKDGELRFSTGLSNLEEGEIYYYRAVIEYKDEIGDSFISFGDVEEFDLNDYSKAPEVTTRSAADIEPDSAILKGKIISFGADDEIAAYGFFYGTSTPPATKAEVGNAGSFTIGVGSAGNNIGAGDEFKYKLSGLQPGTKYYFRSFAENSEGIAYGNIESFTTGKSAPILSPSVFTIDLPVYSLRGSIQVMDVAPYISKSRTYMPIRYAAYAMGLTDANIVWNEASKTVIMTKDSNSVILIVGSQIIYVNGTAMTMDVAPEITNSRTCLPIVWVALAFKYNATWDENARTVTIK